MNRALACLTLAACTGTRAPAVPKADPGNHLVVLVVIDQWPEWAFEQKRPALHGGFERLLAEGEWHVGRYPSAATLTGPDHALLGTGRAPDETGIISDEWWHRDLGTILEAVHDSDNSITAKWLRVPGLGDAVAATKTGAKAIDVALKPRAAILPLGHAGLAIWYDPATEQWSTFQPPAWLADWNRAHPIADHLHDVWTPRPDVAQLAGVPDDDPGEVGSEGFGPTFPHDPQATKAPGKAVLAMPLGNDLVLDLATHAIEAEHLGTHGAPDLLVVGLSAHDYVGHGWGQESQEMWDMELRLDERLARFTDDLDRLIGAGRWTMILTADHGASPLPEKVHGGRMTPKQIEIAANNAASAVLGEGHWIDAAHYPSIVLSKAMLAQPKGELASATKRAMDALRSFPGIERVGRTADYEGHCDARTGDARALCLTFDPERSGELFYLPASGWILQDEDEPAATGHGSLHDYDRLVPLVILAPHHARHAPASAPTGDPIDMLQIAPMLARWLGVPAPATLPLPTGGS
ncbi:MAG: alkaline phosphatase family protein [Acidobacteriota bacterium]